MTESKASYKDRIASLLAEKGYSVDEQDSNILRIKEVDSGVTFLGVLEGNILFCSLTCVTVPKSALTGDAMLHMLSADNGISTSAFRLYPAGPDTVAVTLNNFCTLQSMGPDDEDDVLSCLHYLLVDVMAARQVIGDLVPAANS